MLLSTSDSRTDEVAILDSVDNYKMTLGSMCALAYVLKKHYSAESRIAPTMHAASRDGTRANSPVTPDMLSQGQGVNLIVEVKRSLPNNEGGQNASLDQITKYGRDLEGWKDIPQTHDLLLMTHMSKSSQWADFLAESLKRKKVPPGKNIAVVEYVRDSERETYFILKMVWGKTGNTTLNDYLHNAIVINGKEIIKMMSVAQFYDSKPNVAYTLSVLWGYVFPTLITMDEHYSTKGRKSVDLMVDLDKIMDKLKETSEPFFYPPRQPWISEALHILVKLKMAKHISNNKFIVYYKSIRCDLVKFFAKKIVKAGITNGLPSSSKVKQRKRAVRSKQRKDIEPGASTGVREDHSVDGLRAYF